MIVRTAACRSACAAVLLYAAGSILGFAAAGERESHLDRVLRTHELRVCIWPDYFAISYRDPRTGDLAGVDIDLARELARELDAEVRFVDSSFATLAQDLREDRCDVAMYGIATLLRRARAMSFTDPHLVSGLYAITMRTQSQVKTWADIDRRGVVVAVQAGTYMQPLMKAMLKEAQLLVVDGPFAREEEVQAGRADVFITDYPYGRRMVAQHDWARLIEPPQPIAPTPYAWAIAHGDADWLTFLNLYVATIKRDGRLRAAAERNGLAAIVKAN